MMKMDFVHENLWYPSMVDIVIKPFFLKIQAVGIAKIKISISNQNMGGDMIDLATQLKSDMPQILTVEEQNVKLSEWLSEHSSLIRGQINQHGALLIRGLRFHSSRQFAQAMSQITDKKLLQYTYRSTPRTELKGNVYTATEYPENQTIPQHNENSYANLWPTRIGFLCMIPASTGGETPISNSHAVYKRIPKEIREKFERKKIMYVRNYSDIDLPWQEVFQTNNKSDVGAYCESNNLQFQWLENGVLQTSQINQASIRHPQHNIPVWFNQAHLFHLSNLEFQVQSTLLKSYGEENLPRQTYFADKSKIPVVELDIIREAYEQEKVTFGWQKNDFLILDNILFGHGRNPYTGMRKVLTAMTV